MAHLVRPFDEAKLELLYMNMYEGFWRAEAPRIALFMKGKEFEDRRLTPDDRKKYEEDNRNLIPFQQVPVLLVDGKALAQTLAICGYVGRNCGLYPEGDFAAAKVEELIAFCTDISELAISSMIETDPIRKADLKKELAETKLPKVFRQLEKLIANNGDGKYFMGEMLTIADLCAWGTLNFLNADLPELPKDLIKQYPKVLSRFEAVDLHPKVSEWKSKHADIYKV